MTSNDLEQYKRELMEEHSQEIAAIDRLIARERSKTVSVNGAHSPIHVTARIRRRISVPSAVTSALKKASGQFDKDTVVEQIRAAYPAFTGTASRVARELWKRAKNGELKTIQPGRGRISAIYSKK